MNNVKRTRIIDNRWNSTDVHEKQNYWYMGSTMKVCCYCMIDMSLVSFTVSFERNWASVSFKRNHERNWSVTWNFLIGKFSFVHSFVHRKGRPQLLLIKTLFSSFCILINNQITFNLNDWLNRIVVLGIGF